MMSRHSLLARGLSLLIGAGLGTTTSARAAAPTPGARDSKAAAVRAAFVVQTDELGEGGPPMEDLLGPLEQEVLRDRGVAPATAEVDPRVVIVVRPLASKERIFDNRVDITLEMDGRTLAEPSWGFDCEQCTDGYLFNKAAITLHAVVTRLEQETDAKASRETDEGGSDDPASNNPSVRQEEHGSVKPGPLVWAGGAVAAMGLVGVGVGVGLAVRDDRIEGNAAADQLKRVQTRTPGWVTTGIGAAAFVTGGALLAVGLVRWNRAKASRKPPSKSAASITPWGGPGQLGLGVQGRF